MITAYELKNRPTCRFLYKIPYFVKNIFLLLIMVGIMLPVYICHFRKESLDVQSIYKLLAGLNSRTFNYLEDNAASDLNVKRDLKPQSLQSLDSRKFYTECVSYSRACIIAFMASEWRAAKTWPYQNYGSASLARSLENCPVDVYVDPETTNNKESFTGYSFKEDTVEKMNYKQFLS